MKAAAKENAVLISLEGETVGIIIGHRGETLDSIQYLTSLAASNNGGGYFKVTINIGNYREKREELTGLLYARMKAAGDFCDPAKPDWGYPGKLDWKQVVQVNP